MEIEFRRETLDKFIELKKALLVMPYFRLSEEPTPYYKAVLKDGRGHPDVVLYFDRGIEDQPTCNIFYNEGKVMERRA